MAVIRAVICMVLLSGMVLTGCAIPDPGDEIGSRASDPLFPFSATQAPTATEAVDATADPGTAGAATTEPQVTSDPNVATTPAVASEVNADPARTITFAFDAFPTYFPGVIMETQTLLQKRGYALKLVPFGLNGWYVFSEEERYAHLARGDWDVLATTLESFARRADPRVGAITTLVSERAGTDKLIVSPGIATINDLKGKRIAVTQGSTSEYFLYYTLNVAGLTPRDVEIIPQRTAARAVRAFLDGEADAVSASDPEVVVATEKEQALIDSDKLRVILDILVTSRPALDSKAEAVQAFHDAWYEALRLVIDQPMQAGQAIVDWKKSNWTRVKNAEDLDSSLTNLAQATLGSNQIAFQSPEILVSRIEEAQRIWGQAGGTAPAAPAGGAELIDGRFVLEATKSTTLFSIQPPVNDTFVLASRVVLPNLSSTDTSATQGIARLPLEKCDFEPDTTRLTTTCMDDLKSQVLPVLRTSRLYLQIHGGAAWPAGRYTETDIDTFARERAIALASFLAQQGVDPNRLIVDTLKPKYPNSTDEAQMAEDRIVRFELVSGR